MGTRSRIAVEQPDGTFTSIYVHWDGYPLHQAPILLDHYTDRAKAEQLMALGDLSSLGEQLGERHDFDDRSHDDWCVAYGRDRGETGTEASTSKTLDELFTLTKECGGEYLYLLRQDGVWYFAEGGVSFFGMPASKAPSVLKPLAEAIEQPTD